MEMHVRPTLVPPHAVTSMVTLQCSGAKRSFALQRGAAGGGGYGGGGNGAAVFSKEGVAPDTLVTSTLSRVDNAPGVCIQPLTVASAALAVVLLGVMTFTVAMTLPPSNVTLSSSFVTSNAVAKLVVISSRLSASKSDRSSLIVKLKLTLNL